MKKEHISQRELPATQELHSSRKPVHCHFHPYGGWDIHPAGDSKTIFLFGNQSFQSNSLKGDTHGTQKLIPTVRKTGTHGIQTHTGVPGFDEIRER